MKKIVLRLQYKGTKYCGWQVQKNGLSIQECVQNAVEKIFGFRHDITGCSRTDAGVHANEYFCHLPSGVEFSAIDQLSLALNTALPEDIAVTGAFYADEQFHARYSAVEKEYIYKIYNSNIRNPFLNELTYSYFKKLDKQLLSELGSFFVGKHDFSAFCGTNNNIKSDNIRQIKYCTAQRQGDLVVIAVCGDGFLYNMVRIIIGTMLAAIAGKIKMPIPKIIESKNRKNAGFTVPAQGLYLNKVFYPDGTFY